MPPLRLQVLFRNLKENSQFTSLSSSAAAQYLEYSRCSINIGGMNTFMNTNPFSLVSVGNCKEPLS